MTQRKETKAQRLEREAAERAAYEAEQAATYPQRLMAMLERAQTVNFALEVRNAKFVLVDRDSTTVLGLTLTWTKDNEEALQGLEWHVDMKEEAEREAERKAAVRQAALSKLSKEERELLGL